MVDQQPWGAKERERVVVRWGVVSSPSLAEGRYIYKVYWAVVGKKGLVEKKVAKKSLGKIKY